VVDQRDLHIGRIGGIGLHREAVGEGHRSSGSARIATVNGSFLLGVSPCAPTPVQGALGLARPQRGNAGVLMSAPRFYYLYDG
jgi:hypothetical protein